MLGAFRRPTDPATTLPFSLVSPGGTGVKRRTLGGDGTRNLTLAQVGLAPPAAALLVQWKGKCGATAAWIREDLQQGNNSSSKAPGGSGVDEL